MQIKAADTAANTKHRRQPSANDRPDDTENTGQDKSPAIAPRHKQFGDNAGNQTKNNPGDNSHLRTKKTGLTSKAIRFYEEKGLVTPPLRSENGYRTYTQKHLNELTLLRQARQVGFNLEECGELVNLFNDPRRHSADVKKRTLEKVAEIERHISELQSMRDQLLALAESCPGDDSADCPIIDNLSGCCHHKAQKPR